MIIYKKDTKGKIRQLEVLTDGAKLIQISGIVGGKLIIAEKICKGKNIGKVNATTDSEQAIKQAEALITKKLTEGYYKTIKDATEQVMILPMLAKSYKDEKGKINWNEKVYIQPKFDGMRCLTFIKDGKVTLKSRTGKEINTMRHIVKELESMNLDDMILDGELYCHGETFQENMKMIKKLTEDSEQINYHVYDSVSNNEFIKRLPDLELSPIILPVTTVCIKSEEELLEYNKKFISEGFEGSIIRHSTNGYEINKRSSNLLKYKEFIDKTYKVIDVIPSDARPEQGIIVCDGFKASLKFSHEERAEILRNKDKYIGQTAEIRFFEYTDEGQPRFPVCWGFRLDK